MESTGPTTRARARQGAPLQTSAAPNTRRKSATRSARKSSVPPPDSVPAQEASAAKENDSTIAQKDIPEATSGSGEAGRTEADAPPTVVAPNTAPIPGLTPITATPAAGYCMATPATMGPSPVMPIKLDSLWSPGLPQPRTDLAAPATAAAPERPPAVVEGVDLAAMFISTPAPPADAAASPIEGLVSGEPSAAVAAGCNAEPFAEQPFGGFSETATVESPVAAAADPNQQGSEHQPGAESEQQDDDQMICAGQVSFGSPAAVAMEDATVIEMDDAEPSAPPMSLSHQPSPVASSPGLAAHSSTTSASAAAAAPRNTPGRTPGRASKSPAPTGTPGSPWPESDDDLPEPEDEYPEERALLAEAIAEGLIISDNIQHHHHHQDDQPVAALGGIDEQAYAAAAGQDEFPVVDWAEAAAADADVAGDQPAAEQEGGQAGYVQPDDAADEEQFSEEDLLHDLPTTDDLDDLMEADMPAAVEQDAEPATAVGETATTDLPEIEFVDEVLTDLAGEDATAADVQHMQAVDLEAAVLDDQAAAEADTRADSDAAADTAIYSDNAAEPDMQASAVEQDLEAAMDSCNSPAAASPVEGGADTTSTKEPAAAADAAISPAGRVTGTYSTTAAPPKSALAKPKDAAAAADPKTSGRKSAHVMLPDPSPVKSSYKPGLPGSNNDSSSSPGHTPFPTKSKVRAATSAADRAAAAAAKEVSLKKGIAYARAHSALKHYSTSSTTEQQIDDSLDSAAATAAPASAGKKGSSSGGAKPATSRLLQPTASSIAKSRSSLTTEVDPYVWTPPEADSVSAAAAAGPSKPRLASKVVIPSPPAKAAEPSIKAIKRAIKERTQEKAKETLEEERSAADTQKVKDVNVIRGSRKSSKAGKVAPAPPVAELDFDDEDYDGGCDQDYNAAAGDLADSMAGLSMGPIRIPKPEGPLKGVAAPTGKHFVFDEEGNAKQTPASKLRSAPKHTYFDDEGNPKTSPALPRWR